MYTRTLTRFAYTREFKGEPALQIALTFAEREKTRFRGATDNGTEIAVLLPRGSVLRGNVVLAGEEGSPLPGVLVNAAKEPVVRATVHTPLELAKLAYHLGNRHTPVQLLEPEESDHGMHYALQFKPDDVLAELAERLGGHVHGVIAAFEPEGGAYSGVAHAHAHQQNHAHDHAHDHGGHDHEHVHTADCAHDHGHDHEHSHDHAHGHEHHEAHDHNPAHAHEKPAELPAQREDPVHIVRIHRPGKAPVERVIRGPGHHG